MFAGRLKEKDIRNILIASNVIFAVLLLHATRERLRRATGGTSSLGEDDNYHLLFRGPHGPLHDARYIELTHVIEPDMPIWPGFGPPKISASVAGRDFTSAGEPFSYQKHGFVATGADFVAPITHHLSLSSSQRHRLKAPAAEDAPASPSSAPSDNRQPRHPPRPALPLGRARRLRRRRAPDGGAPPALRRGRHRARRGGPGVLSHRGGCRGVGAEARRRARGVRCALPLRLVARVAPLRPRGARPGRVPGGFPRGAQVPPRGAQHPAPRTRGADPPDPRTPHPPPTGRAYAPRPRRAPVVERRLTLAAPPQPLDTDASPNLAGEAWLMHHGYMQLEGVANLHLARTPLFYAHLLVSARAVAAAAAREGVG